MTFAHGATLFAAAIFSVAMAKKDDDIVFSKFVAHNSTMTCTASTPTEQQTIFDSQKIQGVNLGGWMVLEPWITPSLFYQFLGGGVNSTAFDMYTFCDTLGAEEANKQLRRHWNSWVSEDIIKQLAESRAVNSLRLPIGDFQFVPYGPYEKCVEGGLEYVDTLLDWAQEHGLSVLLDVHTMKDSQNGFDNSGQTSGFEWTHGLSSEFFGLNTFQHWPLQSANWMGTFDREEGKYTDINYSNIEHALEVVRRVVKRYGNHPAVFGMEPVNEPWQNTPLDELKRFYWEGYLIVKNSAKYWHYVMHDSFRFSVWGGFMSGCPERILDTHIYQAWNNPGSRSDVYGDACRQKSAIAKVEDEFGPVVVGEWSLATDNCAMWLNGFNDNLPGFPRLPCKYTPCNKPYMGTDQPGTPVDPSKPMQGPFGTGISGPVYGLCPGSRDWIKESSTQPISIEDWLRDLPSLPQELDGTDEVMKALALKKINAFSGIGHGFYFWNFRTDLYEPQWSYMAALERGWIPRGKLIDDEMVLQACQHEEVEDLVQYRCVLKERQLEESIRGAIKYVFDVENQLGTPKYDEILSQSGPDLEESANRYMTFYFKKHRSEGGTCDFGGIAVLVEVEDIPNYDDDLFGAPTENGNSTSEKPGFSFWLITAGVSLSVGGILGLVIAARSPVSMYELVSSSFTGNTSEMELT